MSEAIPTVMNHTGSRFKNAQGAYLTRSLFFEVSPEPELAVFTLKDYDHEWKGRQYKSLYLLYMQEADPIEYEFATKHLDSWVHWEKLSNSPFFQEYITRWRKELELKIRSESLRNIATEARKGGRDAMQAHRYLLERKWLDEPSKARGRPTKAEIKKAAFDLAAESESLTEDFNRISSPAIN
jgi:hypothetical protein